MLKEFIIQGKGEYNRIVNDPYFGEKEISDIQSGYGYINFKGTDKQLDSFYYKSYGTCLDCRTEFEMNLLLKL